jgi:hypothetical protein
MLGTRILAAVVTAVSVLSTAAHANDGAWVTIENGPITIKTRELAGSPVHEILAEADLDATPGAVVRAVSDVDRFSK